MRKLIAVVALLALPSLASAQSFAEIMQGITDPHVVGGASYNQDTKKWAAVLTANIVGPKLGTLPCYVSGVGVGLNTVAPGLEEASIAALSLPLLTCAPWGEQVALQVGIATPLNGDGTGTKSYFVGVGISLSGGPNELSAKRVRRAAAKKARKAMLEQGPPAPAS